MPFKQGRSADNQMPGRTMLGMGDIVDAAQFKAYKALVPIEISMKMFGAALEHAQKTSTFRLAFTEQYLDRAVLLHEAGEDNETVLTLLRAGLKEITDSETAGDPPQLRESRQEIFLQFARTFASQGAVDEGINIIRKKDKKYRTRFAEFYLSQEGSCSSAQDDIISISKKLNIRLTGTVIAGASIACARYGNEKTAISLLERAVSRQDRSCDFLELQKIVQIAYALGDRKLIEKSIRSYLDSCRYGIFISTTCIRGVYSVAEDTIY